MNKKIILGILIIMLLTTTISSALPTQNAVKEANAKPSWSPTPIYGCVRDKDTNEPISGAHVKFIIFGFRKDTTISDGYYGETTSLLKSRNCTGIAWVKGYLPKILHVYIRMGGINEVNFYLKHL
jgi:hypothetical protein